jgi:hypothetical protein
MGFAPVEGIRSAMGRHRNLPDKKWIALVALSIAGVLSPALLQAQAPPGPMAPTQPRDSRAPAGDVQPQAQRPPVQPRTSIFGAWKFNPDDSDDPRKPVQQTRGGGGNRRMGGGYPGGGGGYGGPRMGSQGESDEQRQRMQELFSPSRGLTLAEGKKDAEVDLFDDQQRKRAFFLDGRKLQKSKDLNYQEIAAHWEGARLVTDEKSPRGGKMSRTYELSYDGTQLYETLHTTVGRNNTPLVLRYVYDQAAGSAAARVPPLTAPAQPAAAPTHRQ